MKSKIVVLAVLMLLPLSLVAREKRDFTESFPLADCDFSAEGGNAYFILQPGRELHYDNLACVADGDCDEAETLVISVLDETRDVALQVDGEVRMITTRVVQEYEEADGAFAERSLNFFAVCGDSGDVYYFGEEVFVPDGEGGEMGGAEGPGAWLAGEAGGEDEAVAQPGIIMPGGAFLLGARYYQEVAPGVALDRAEHTAMGLEVGDFSDCVEVTETTPLEKKAESIKVYCPGVGLTVDDELELADPIE